MRARRCLLTAALGFGIGLAIAKPSPVAHACSCDLGERELALESVSGEGAPQGQIARWECGLPYVVVYEQVLWVYGYEDWFMSEQRL